MYPIAITICFYVQCRLLVFSHMRTTGSSSERLHTLAAMVDEGDMRALVRLRLFKYVCSRYVSVWVYAYVYTYIYTCMHMYLCCVCVCCMYVCIYICICICIYIYIFMYVCMYIYIYIDIYLIYVYI